MFVQKDRFSLFEQTRSNEPAASLRCCELSHCAIAGDGTWINLSAILAEEETMSGADAFFSSRL
nr:hypothetical protein [Evansella caseinilytica]